MFILIIVFLLLSSILSLSLAGILVMTSQQTRQKLIPILVSYAAGILLGAVFINILPEAIELSGTPEPILLFVLVGIVLFFVLEKLVLWRHCYRSECEVHQAAGPLILVGDAFHNLVDGIVIASAFLVSIPAGISVSIAVTAHELPQEMGDFVLLLDYGYTSKKAFLYNIISSATTLLGGIVTFYTLTNIKHLIPYVLAVSAASFLYIALADILPELTKKMKISESIIQLLLLFLGIATIVML